MTPQHLNPWQWQGKALDAPLRLRQPRVIEVPDLFADSFTDDDRDRHMAVMALTPQHTYLLATEHVEAMAKYFDGNASPDRVFDAVPSMARNQGRDASGIRLAMHTPWPLPNLMLGVTIRDRADADARIPHLLKCPAALRWLDARLRGPVDLANISIGFARGRHYIDALAGVDLTTKPPTHSPAAKINFVRVTGGSEPLHPDWLRSLAQQCVAAAVPFMFCGWGEWEPVKESDGGALIVASAKPEKMLVIDERGSQGPWHDWRENRYQFAMMKRVGKRKSGRLLDGRTWDEFPCVESEVAQ